MHRLTTLSRGGSSTAWTRSVVGGASSSRSPASAPYSRLAGAASTSSSSSSSSSSSLPSSPHALSPCIGSSSSRTGARRGYAVPVNTKTSVDHLLGVAPPMPPRPQPQDEAGDTSSAVPNALVGTARSPNPNNLSDLLRGGDGSSGSSRGNGGVVTRRPGTALPTEDLDVLFGQQQRENRQRQEERGEQKQGEKEAAQQQQQQQQQQPVNREQPHAIDALYGRNDLDERILAAARAVHHGRLSLDVGSLLELHDAQAGYQLSVEVPYESRPKEGRRVPVTSAASSDDEAGAQAAIDDGVVLIAYVAGLEGKRGQERISVCSGFAVEGGDRLGEGEGKGKGALIVTCAHTLRASMPAASPEGTGSASAALAITRSGHIYPIVSLLSSMPHSDLVLLQLSETPSSTAIAGLPSAATGPHRVRTLPLNPYPAEVGSELCVSSFWGWEDDSGSTLPAFEFDASAESSSSSAAAAGAAGASASTALRIAASPLPPPPGRDAATVRRERDDAVRSRWGRARLVEYRDSAGKEARAGTYDELSQMDFKLLHDSIHNPPALADRLANFPPPGSSGGPIVDAASGSVVGVTRGSRMSQLQGKRGDGVPAERVFFFFALPGLGRTR